MCETSPSMPGCATLRIGNCATSVSQRSLNSMCSRLHIELSERWETDVAQLPIRKVAQPGIDGDVSHMDFDNGFEGWKGPARIRDEKVSLQLTSSLPYLVVYTPQHKDYFCIEPVSHVGN